MNYKIREGFLASIGADAVPNWIGPQRFGSTRPVTPMVGKAVIAGDLKFNIRGHAVHAKKP